eukprot:EG_transcript_3969
MSRIPVRGIKSLVAAHRRASEAPPPAPDRDAAPNPLLDLIVDRVDKQRVGLQNKSELTGLQGDLEQLSRLFGNEELKSQLRAAWDEVQALRKQLQAHAALQREMADLRQDFDRLSREYQEYREAMEEQYAAATAAVAEVQATLAAAEEQHVLDAQARDAAATFQLQQLQAKLHFAEDELRRTEATLAEVRAEGSALRQQVADALASHAAAAGELQRQRQQQQQRSAAWAREADELRQRLAQAQNDGAQAAGRAGSEAERLRLQSGDLAQRLAQAEAELVAFRAERDRVVAGLEAQLAAATEQTKRLEAAAAGWRETERRREAERRELQAALDAAVGAAAALQAELDRARHSLLEGQGAAEEVQSLREQLQASTAHAQQLERLLEAAKASGADGLTALRTQLAAAERGRTAAEDAGRRLEAAAAGLREALAAQRRQAEASGEEARRLMEQLEAVRLAAEESERGLESVRQTNEGLRQELEDFQARCAGLQEALAQAERDRDAARAVPHRTAALEAELAAAREAAEERGRSLQAATAETERVRRQLDGLQLQLKGAEGDLVALTRLRAQLEGQLAAARREAGEARQEAERRAKESRGLSEELEALRQKQAVEDKRVENQLARLKVLQETAVAVTRKLIAAEEGAESLHTCLACLRIFARPTTCVPCGHTFCLDCLPRPPVGGGGLCCPECERAVQHHFQSDALDMLSGKYTYRRQVLGDLLRELMQATG